jgi:hypothetical protein
VLCGWEGAEYSDVCVIRQTDRQLLITAFFGLWCCLPDGGDGGHDRNMAECSVTVKVLDGL